MPLHLLETQKSISVNDHTLMSLSDDSVSVCSCVCMYVEDRGQPQLLSLRVRQGFGVF